MWAVVAFFLSSAVIGGIVRFVVFVLGVGVVSFIGIDTLMGTLEGYASNAFSSGGQFVGILGMMGVPEAINLVLSGCSVRLSLMAAKQFRVIK